MRHFGVNAERRNKQNHRRELVKTFPRGTEIESSVAGDGMSLGPDAAGTSVIVKFPTGKPIPCNPETLKKKEKKDLNRPNEVEKN